MGATAEVHVIGRIEASEGVVAIADTFAFEQKWINRMKSNGSWCIDFHGEESKRIAARSEFAVVELADGGHRLIVPDKIRAGYVSSPARKLINREELKTSMSVRPLNCSVVRIEDACRGSGIGVVNSGKDAMVALKAPKGVKVQAIIEDGEVVKIELILIK